MKTPTCQKQILALRAAAQFLDPNIPRGPDVNGWSNTVEFVHEVLRDASALGGLGMSSTRSRTAGTRRRQSSASGAGQGA
jgi:hypothetical protein